MSAPQIDWLPTDRQRADARITDFARFAAARAGRELADYRTIWRWSVEQMSDFWSTVAKYFDVIGTGLEQPALADTSMPGARWFPGATVNYAQNLLRMARDPRSAQRPAILVIDEEENLSAISWRTLEARVAGLAASLRELGVEPGDRVAAVLPNVAEAVVGLLAAASIGALWTINSPELAEQATTARLAQLAPRVLISASGYRYNGRTIDRSAHLAALAGLLDSVEHLVLVGADDEQHADLTLSRRIFVHDFSTLAGRDAAPAYTPTAFDHPLWVLFSSGTTGAPKGIVHGHGGVLLEALKSCALQYDMGPRDAYYVAANTSWMVWNAMVNALAAGATIVTYSGSPTYGDPARQFRIVAHTGATMFGVGAAYLQLVERSGSDLAGLDTSRLRFVLSTGSPLPASTWRWARRALGPRVHIGSDSGGTDICSCFVGSNPLEPAYLGESQGPMLGAAVEAWDDTAARVVGQVGDMVITAPMPSMPLHFWNDDHNEKLTAAYFERHPGVWLHGDWITETERGGFLVHGRSDATLNRGGVRLGSSDIYAALRAVPEVIDAMVIGAERPDGSYYMPLFVVLEPGMALTDPLRTRITDAIRSGASPRHVPDEVIQAPGIPTTHTGKKAEVPIKKLYLGRPVSQAVNLDALVNPETVSFYVEHAAETLTAHPRAGAPR